jgi:hypothetical protein
MATNHLNVINSASVFSVAAIVLIPLAKEDGIFDMLYTIGILNTTFR